MNLLARAYRSLGLLGWVGVLTLVVGAIIQHLSTHLPPGYTWLLPFDTLRYVFAQEWVPTSFFVVAVMGELRRRSKAPFDETAHPWRPFVIGCAIALLDVVLNPLHNAADVGSVLCVAVIAARAPMGERRWVKVLGHFAVGAAVFAFICYFYSVVKALTLVDRTQVDGMIADFERDVVGEYPHQLVAAWASTRPNFVHLCDWAYFHLFQHMTMTTILLTSMRQRTERFEYLGALGLCYTIGAGLYHVFPAVGPAYYDAASYRFLFEMDVSANPIRAQLFHYTTAVLNGQEDIVHTWGYVACMPSLHIAHELVMLYYARRSRIAFTLSLAFTGVTLIAVVVLGWHYFLDEFGGLIVAIVSILIARWQRDKLMPAALAPEPDEPLVDRPIREWLVERWNALPALPAVDEARASRIVRVVAVVALVVRLAIGLRDLGVTDRLFVADDAFTMLAIGRSLAHGLGASVNGVALAHGFQPLIPLLSMPLFWVTSSPLAPLGGILFLAVIADAASVWLLGGIARRLGGPTEGVIAAAAWAFSPLAIANALDGLETAFAFAFQLAFVELLLRAREHDKTKLYLAAGVVAGLALYARVDSMILVIAATVLLAPRRAAHVVGAGALVVAPWAIYALVRLGHVVPEQIALAHSSLHAPFVKQLAAMGGTLLGASVTDLATARSWLFEHPVVGVAVLAGVLASFAHAVKTLRSPALVALAISAVALVALYLPALWFARHFVAPVYGVAALILALAVTSAGTDLRRRFAALLVFAAAASFGLGGTGHFLRRRSDSADLPNGYATRAQALLANLPPGAVLGTFQSGALGYFAPSSVEVVDLDGVVDPDARRARDEGALLDYAYARHVTYLADWRFNVESLRVSSAKSRRAFDAKPLGQAEAQGQIFTLYAVSWPE